MLVLGWALLVGDDLVLLEVCDLLCWRNVGCFM